MRFKTLILANTAEAFSKPISYLKSNSQKKDRIRIENVLSQRAIFWEEDNKIIVTVSPIPPGLFLHNYKILGFNNVVNISPKYISHSLCRNILSDKSFFKKLTEVIKDNPGILIAAYAYTKELNNLIEKLKVRNLSYKIHEKPNKDISTVSYLDSKAGFREVIGSLQGVLLPGGYICRNKSELISRALDFQKNNYEFVIKANEGESGWGLLIAKGEIIKNKIKLLKIIESELEKDGIWASKPYVIERYIDQKEGEKGGSPSIELSIDNNGVNINYSCDQLFNKEGQFSGIAMGKGIVGKTVQKTMEDMSRKIGKKYYELGYRGFFDIDFIISKDNLVYALETNTRRTGGTHVFDLAKRIFRDKWQDHVFISNDSFKYGDRKLSINDILDKLKDILFPMKGEEGFVLSIFDDKKPILGYILVSNSLERAKQLEVMLFDYFSFK